MLKRWLGFNLQDNAFTALDDPEVAQELADSFAELKWTKILDRLACQVNPLMFERWFRGLCYYSVVDQAEYATDLIFTGRAALAGLYPRLLDHAAVNFSGRDILSFLGRRFHPRFDGKVLTDGQKGRPPGARIKHRVKKNWLICTTSSAGCLGFPRPCAPRRDPPRKCAHGAGILRSKTSMSRIRPDRRHRSGPVSSHPARPGPPST